MAKSIKVTLIRSGINRPEAQKRTIRRLGLGKLGRSSVVPDGPAIRGMVRAVSHLVKVETAD